MPPQRNHTFMPLFTPRIAPLAYTPPKKGLGQRALESVVLTTIEGANQAGKSMASPISRAMEWKNQDAAKAKDNDATKNPQGWGETWRRAKEVVFGDQEKVRKDAIANAHQHSKSTLPITDKIKGVADKVVTIADENSARIRPHLNVVEKGTAKVLGMAPELLLSGPSKTRVVANRVVTAAQNYGEHKSIPGAIGELLIPGNSKRSNIASNLIGDAIASSQPASLKKTLLQKRSMPLIK